jgi:transcriptional regulator with XRE-family HTH domain
VRGNIFARRFDSKEGVGMSLGAKLLRLRVEKKMSLQDLATALDISKTHLWEIEKGRSRNPSIEILTSIANHFRIPIADLVGENPNAEGEDAGMVAMYRNLKQLSEPDRETIRVLMERLKHSRGNSV